MCQPRQGWTRGSQQQGTTAAGHSSRAQLAYHVLELLVEHRSCEDVGLHWLARDATCHDVLPHITVAVLHQGLASHLDLHTQERRQGGGDRQERNVKDAIRMTREEGRKKEME